MSMPLALEHTQEWLREKNGWKDNECGVQYDALPMLQDAGQFYVAIDDAGVETGNELTDSIKEILTLTIGIWRRQEHLSQRDRKSILKLPTDKYLLGSWTLFDLERTVLLPRLNGLHANYAFVTALNLRYNLPDEDFGATFILPLFYRGRGRMETYGVDDGGATQCWYGYRLRFRGLAREQKLRSASWAQG
jgi:hypothetical protein